MFTAKFLQRLFLAPLATDFQNPKSLRQTRRLAIEQFEPRRLLAIAYDDDYFVNEGETLTVSGDGTWANDTYIASWDPYGHAGGEVWDGPYYGTLTEIDTGDDWTDYDEDGNVVSTGYYGLAFTYTPDISSGDDTFTYSLGDNESYCFATVTIHVNGLPTPADDSFEIDEDNAVSGNVLTNDSDPEDEPLSAIVTNDPTNGSVTLDADGTFTYTPNPDFNGTDSFVYAADDGMGSTPATVTITVDPVNDPPTAGDDDFLLNLSIASALTVEPSILWNDGDIDGDSYVPLLVSAPAFGALTFNSNGSFSYTPDPGFVGTDSFTYQISDGQLLSNVAAVTIAVDTAPIAGDDAYTTTEATPLDNSAAANLLANDVDADGDPVTATLLMGPAHGTLALNADGTFVYTPAADFDGTDSFTYAATDGVISSAAATVTIEVLDPHVAADDSYSLDLGQSGALAVNASTGLLANDTSPSTNSLSAGLLTLPASGTLTLNADGSFSYTPAAGFAGLDSFTYRATDGSIDSTPATVTIDVTTTQDISADSLTTDGVSLTIAYNLAVDVSTTPQITLYASPDGFTLGQPLETFTGDSTAGAHTLTIDPEFDDPSEDYYLLAKVDSGDAIAELDDTNNVMLFVGGAFLLHEPTSNTTVLEVHTTDWADAVTVTQPSNDSLQLNVSPADTSHTIDPDNDVGLPDYDVNGDGVVSQADADAVAYDLVHTDRPWQNPANRFDVDRDGTVSPSDSLAIINYVNAFGPALLDRPPTETDPFYDVNGDGTISSIDAQDVSNFLDGGDGNVTADHQNAANPLDANADGVADRNDELAIDSYLSSLAVSDSTGQTADYSTDPNSPSPVSAVMVRAHGGDDRITLDTPADVPTSSYGGEGNDLIQGSAGDDTIDGGTGNDDIYDDQGDNTVSVGGDAGSDMFGGFSPAGAPTDLNGVLVPAPPPGGSTTTLGSGGSQPALVGYTAEDSVVSEGQTKYVRFQHLPGGGMQAVTLTVQVEDGDAHFTSDPPVPPARAGSDFTGGTYTVTIPAGEDSVSDPIAIPFLRDSIVEQDEALWVEIVSVQGGYAPPPYDRALYFIHDASIKAVDDITDTKVNTSVPVNILANDINNSGGTLTVELTTQADNGMVEITDGVATYTPNTDYVGDDSFSYTIHDANGQLSTATVIVHVIQTQEQYVLTWSISGDADEGPEADPDHRTPVPVTLTVTLDHPAPAGGITASFYTLSPAALKDIFGTDYNALDFAVAKDLVNPNVTVTIPAGATSSEPIDITPDNDDIVERNEQAWMGIHLADASADIVTQTSQYVVTCGGWFNHFKIRDNEWRWVEYFSNPPPLLGNGSETVFSILGYLDWSHSWGATGYDTTHVEVTNTATANWHGKDWSDPQKAVSHIGFDINSRTGDVFPLLGDGKFYANEADWIVLSYLETLSSIGSFSITRQQETILMMLNLSSQYQASPLEPNIQVNGLEGTLGVTASLPGADKTDLSPVIVMATWRPNN